MLLDVFFFKIGHPLMNMFILSFFLSLPGWVVASCLSKDSGVSPR